MPDTDYSAGGAEPGTGAAVGVSASTSTTDLAAQRGGDTMMGPGMSTPDTTGRSSLQNAHRINRSASFIEAVPKTPQVQRQKDTQQTASDLKRKAARRLSWFQQLGYKDKMGAVCTFSLPCTNWACPYDVQNLKSDIISGLTVGVMVIPQSISYASLAGLAPIYGLYAALFPAFVYGALGTSAELAVGPVAIVSLQVASGLSGIVEQEDPNYPQYCFMVAFIAGGLQLCVGLLQMGFLINFLSHSVISGFTSGASVIIGLSQLKYFFGIHPSGGKKVTDMVGGTVDRTRVLVSDIAKGLGLTDHTHDSYAF